jgi:hypothetical protein
MVQSIPITSKMYLRCITSSITAQAVHSSAQQRNAPFSVTKKYLLQTASQQTESCSNQLDAVYRCTVNSQTTTNQHSRQQT